MTPSASGRELLPLLIVVQCASFSRHRYAIFHPRGQTVEVSTAIFFAVGEAYQKGRRGHRRCAAVDRGRRIVLPCQPRVKHLPAGGRAGERAAFPCGKNCPDTVRNRGFGAVLVASAASVPMTKPPSLPASLQVPSRVDGPTRGERERGLETGDGGGGASQGQDTSRTRARATASSSFSIDSVHTGSNLFDFSAFDDVSPFNTKHKFASSPLRVHCGP